MITAQLEFLVQCLKTTMTLEPEDRVKWLENHSFALTKIQNSVTVELDLCRQIKEKKDLDACMKIMHL